MPSKTKAHRSDGRGGTDPNILSLEIVPKSAFLQWRHILRKETAGGDVTIVLTVIFASLLVQQVVVVVHEVVEVRRGHRDQYPFRGDFEQLQSPLIKRRQ